MVYINLPVKPNTKKIIDEYRKRHGLKSYDDTLLRVFEEKKKGSFEQIKDLEGTLKGAPPFVRDKRDRHFD